ncbi:serine/threonine protein kinase [Chondromyces crocatus]|uniref:Uncharacterized protein n=1 Tax=Chondromyces crocatus TaxID=52 RepID=A0A0K1E7X3_CHOCO|nr:serine/threonine protein kinase [Chondromyces crocatus]AKT36965.1 uncharacterized protein CMC5_010860 [Chondromyces crocatus]
MSEDREEFEKRLGTVLRGKWRLDRLIGIGGMAAVYAATHSIGRQEAIKILHPDIARNKDLRARFEREAQAVNKFHHPGVVEIRDIDVTDDGVPFLVMELLDGEPLWDRAQRLDGIDAPELLRITDELLDVLAAAHDQGIIHRDIKPDNLFLLRDGRIKVLDFGIAHLRDGVRTELRTRAGATLGTVSYMAPEQVKGTGVDQRSDLFSVGATMFRIVTKRRLHEARTDSELLVKMATQPAPRLGTIARGAPPGLCLIVDRALAFEKERRYPDARTMQQDVRSARRGELPSYAMAQLSEGHLPGTAAPSPAVGVPSAPPQRGSLPSLPSSVIAGGGAAIQASFAPTLIQDAGSEISLGSPPTDSPASTTNAAASAPLPSTPHPGHAQPPQPHRGASGVASTLTATATYDDPTGAQRRTLHIGILLSVLGVLVTLLLVGALWFALRDDDTTPAPSSPDKPANALPSSDATPDSAFSTTPPEHAPSPSAAPFASTNLSTDTAPQPVPLAQAPVGKATATSAQGNGTSPKVFEVDLPNVGKIKLNTKKKK